MKHYAGLDVSVKESSICIVDNSRQGKRGRTTFEGRTVGPFGQRILSLVEAFLTAQDSFVQTIKAKVATNTLTNSDLLPDDAPQWENLIAPWAGSQNLEEFLARECGAERSTLMHQNPVRAFYATSLSFCAPAFVPIDKFRGVSADTLLQALERAASLPDHFAVAGAFEICAGWIGKDNRIESVGIKLLDQLLSSIEKLKTKCTFFAGILR